MTIKEQSRIQVLNGVIEREVTVPQAAGLMEVSERQAWRLLAAYREEGAAAMAHGNRGRKPSTTTCPEIQQKVRELAEAPYAGFNHTHLTEMLAEREDIHLSRSTVRRILLAEGRAESPSPQGLQTLQPEGALPAGRDAAADRWEPARLATGPRSPPDSRRRCRRRHRDGPIRCVQTSRRCPRLHADAQGDHRSPRCPPGSVQ